MFGHDNQDNEDDNNNNNGGQITLPPAPDAGSDNQDAPAEVPTPPPAVQDNEAAVDAIDHRKVAKTGAPTDDLLDIKQEALQALTPLVDHLDQSPEEKFRTTMMMIQASDNHTLIKSAYQAAQQISSEKERAQALLDIVNEINYFTQQSQAQA